MHHQHEFPLVEHAKLSNKMSVNELVLQLKAAGVMGAGRIGRATDIAETMFRNKDCTIFLGIAGAMIPGGMKNVIIDLLKTGVSVFVTTGAMLTHDLIESLGHRHMKGTPHVDDALLHKKNIVRMYDSYMSSTAYKDLEDFFAKHFDELATKSTVSEMLWALGLKVPTQDSILRFCAEQKIPIFCPALADSGLGLMIWGQLARGKKMLIPAFDDLKDMMQLAWNAKQCGVWYVCGGVPKNFIQQAMQFSPKGASYGIQITTDRPEPGGSSGAELREGISWGKMEYSADFVDVPVDATVALPLIVAALKERLNKKD